MESKIEKYNIRVYGVLVNQRNEVLLSEEELSGKRFVKFPGGGHQFGEGIKECLEREFKEELNIDIEVGKHFYTTDFFQASAFSNQEQLISIYYEVTSKQIDSIKHGMQAIDEKKNKFYWKSILHLHEGEVTFPIDKLVVGKIKAESIF